MFQHPPGIQAELTPHPFRTGFNLNFVLTSKDHIDSGMIGVGHLKKKKKIMNIGEKIETSSILK